MAKFDIPKFRYLWQDQCGEIYASIKKPKIYKDGNEWQEGKQYYNFSGGKENPNWRDTLIDLETDDYEFEDGILRRVEK